MRSNFGEIRCYIGNCSSMGGNLCLRICIIPLLHGGVLRHGISPIHSKGADRQQRDCHHQRQQEGNNSFFHPVIFLSLS